VLVVTLALGIGAVAWQARRAERQAARATAIKDYVIGLFDNLYPHGGKPNEHMTAKALLDIGADRADAAFAHDPATEIELLNTLQSIYDVSDDADHAEKVGLRKLELQRALYGPTDPRVLSGTVDLVVTQVMFLDSGRARTMLDQIRASLFASTDSQSLPRALWLYGHANALRGVHGGRDEAIAECEEAIHIFAAHYPRDMHYPDALMVLSGYLHDAERYADALRVLERHRAVSMALGRYDAMAQLQFELQQGPQIESLGQLDEADGIFHAAQDRAEHLVGRQSTWFVITLVDRALLAHHRGDRERAMSMFAAALTLGGDRLETTGFITQVKRAYGAALSGEGDAAAAIPLLEAGLAQEQLRPREEYTVRQTQSYLGDAYDQLGEADKARVQLRAAYEGWVRYGAPGGARTLGARERWARFQWEHGDTAEAATEFKALLKIAGATPSAPAALAQAGLARIALARGDVKEAGAASEDAMRILGAVTMEYDVRARVDVWLARAEALRASGELAASRAMAQQAVAAAEHDDAPMSPRLARARAVLARVE
jgi:serine/threonine-protein kinase